MWIFWNSIYLFVFLKCFGVADSPYLFTGDSWVSVGRRAEDQVIKDGGVRCDADTATHHHRYLELVPILIAAAEWTLDSKCNNYVVFLFIYKLLKQNPKTWHSGHTDTSSKECKEFFTLFSVAFQGYSYKGRNNFLVSTSKVLELWYDTTRSSHAAQMLK